MDAAVASERLTRRGRIFANPVAGPRSVSDEDLTSRFPGDDIERTKPEDLVASIEAFIADSSSSAFVAVAGGDGTVRCAAETLARTGSDRALLVVPAGTRNHFAHDVGLDDLDAAASTAGEGDVRSVDLGWVNGAFFVNNSSIGVYPHLVVEREGREHRLPKRVASVTAAWHQLRKGRRITAEIDGVSRRVWAVFIGNNRYGETVRDLTGRDRLDDGVLDVRIARADRRLSRLRIAAAVLFNRLAKSPLIDRRDVPSVVIDVGSSVEVALDGEVVTMSSPLRYRSSPHALRVLVPA
jgi:undecaprenyl-diphosphatase